MSAFRPEAGTEYSRGPEASEGRERALQRPSPGLATALLIGTLAGALLLLAAEFTPLLEIHSTLHRAPISSISTGSHDAYALIPIGLLAALLGLVVWRTRNRVAQLAVGTLGLVALLIALLGDLPDAQATGVLVHPYTVAGATPSTGFYLETLGAVVLILAAVAGLLFLDAPARRGARGLRAAPSTGD